MARSCRSRESSLLLSVQLLACLLALASGSPVASAEDPKQADRNSKSHQIVVRCVDAASRTPLTGVRVRLFVLRGLVATPEQVAEAVTDSEGRHTFEGVPRSNHDWTRHRRINAVVVELAGRQPTVALDFYRHDRHHKEMTIVMQQASEKSFVGKVVNKAGQPVEGAIVAAASIEGHSIPGILNTTTDHDGHFELRGLAEVRPVRDQKPTRSIWIIHPDYPRKYYATPVNPDAAEVVLPDGCVLSGVATDGNDGTPLANIMIVAQPMRSGATFQTATDSKGRFRLNVLEGNYNILAETEELVAPALPDVECPAGKSIELPPLKMTPGGILGGKVFDPLNGQPVVMDDGERITVGVTGPARPIRNVLSPERLAEVDDNGEFRIRVAAGDNYPYLVNARGSRMIWDTRKQPPVVVNEGERAYSEIQIDRPKSAAQKLAEADEAIEKLPTAPPPARAAAILVEFRKLNSTLDHEELWCSLLRELVAIGPNAVDPITAELDTTDEANMIRRLCFALRAIGDARAVPALIRAIPKTLPSSGDYGLLVEDAGLLKFMQQHDLDNDKGRYFSVGSTKRELFGTLHKFTGQDFADSTLHSISLSKNPRRAHRQRELYQRQAERWQAWWEQNWQTLTQDTSAQKVNLPALADVKLPATTELGPNANLSELAEMDSGLSGMTLSPSTETGGYTDYFIDLDTGFEPKWPDEIPRAESVESNAALAKWAADSGVDLMCVIYRQPDLPPVYALRALNMQLWEISDQDAENIEKRVKAKRLPAGRRVPGDLLLHTDEKTQQLDPQVNAAFLYVTREGNPGLIVVKDQITRTENLNGQIIVPKGVGFHKGVKFDLHYIVP